MEYYNSTLNIKIVTDLDTNNVQVIYVTSGLAESHIIDRESVEMANAWIEEEENSNRIPGIGLGMLLIRLGRAFEKAAGGGTSAT